MSIQFLGETFVPERDEKRLGLQLRAVKALMLDGTWRTLRDISDITESPEASVSARLRDLRRLGFVVEREYVSRGLFRYRVLPAPPPTVTQLPLVAMIGPS